MWNDSSGFVASDLHKQAEELREKDQLDEAIEVNNQAIEEYRSKENWEGVVRALQSRVLIYKHKYLLTKDTEFINLAKKDAIDSLKIAQFNNLSLVISGCSFRLGEIDMIGANYEEAQVHYQKAIDEYVGSEVEKGDYKYHLGEAVYKSGDKKRGKQLLLEGLSLIQDNIDEVDSFLIHVWESGCYMRLAECLRNDNRQEAMHYLDEAKKIIDSDKNLIIRKRQWQVLADSF